MANRRRALGGSRARKGRNDLGDSFGGASDDRVFTPLIDIFIAIVFFLMVGMTAGGEFVSVNPDVELPHSTGEDASDELTVAISTDRILIGGEPVMSVQEAMASASASEPYLIPQLFEQLRVVRDDIEATLQEDETFRGVLAIQGDRKIPYAVLSRVMYSARKAGFSAFNLHVVSEQASSGAEQGSPSSTSALSSTQ